MQRELYSNSRRNRILCKQIEKTNMDLKPIPEGVDLDLQDFSEIINPNSVFWNTPLLLEKNENSDLVAISKPPTQEFFERVFDPAGPFWSIYSGLGFATRPYNTRYVTFIKGQMYFLKNIENRYMSGIGPEKTFELEDLQLKENIRPTITNLLLLLSAPFDAIKQHTRAIELGFMANEAIREFEEFRGETIGYHKHYSLESNITNPSETIRESLEKAVHSMKYTNLALLSYTLKIKLRKTEAIENCETRKLNKLIEQGDWDSVRKTFGFYSLTPYDVTKPRFREDTTGLERFGSPEPPEDYRLKWRENAKYLCARYLDIERIALKKLGEQTGTGDLVFYLKTGEIKKLEKDQIDLAEKRRKNYMKYENMKLPPRIIYYKGGIYEQQKNRYPAWAGSIQSTSVSSKRIAAGPAVNINNLEDYLKCTEGSIIISKTLSPNLSILYRKAAGIVSESGGYLSHAAVIAREMNIPCLIQAKLPAPIIDGQYLQINGKTGEIKILDRIPAHQTKKEKNTARKTTRQGIKGDITAHEKPALKDIIWLGEADPGPSAIGSKASNLCRLYGKYPIPPGFCITNAACRKIIDEEKLDSLTREIKDTDPADIRAIDNTSKKIREYINSCQFPPKLEKELDESISKLSLKSLAVRSSASLEDLGKTSSAGQLDSYLGITKQGELKEAIRKCFASYYNTRAILYRIENRIRESETNMSVIVQEMIEAEYSGVMFTENPDNREEMIIEIVPGLCENLVSGKTTPDTYIINREKLSINTPKNTQGLDHNTISEIAATGLKIEETLQQPQDIEWSIDHNKKLWILQSRPITAYRIP